MLNICLVLIVVAGLLFIYYVFFAKKDSHPKEKMEGQPAIEIVNYNTDWCGYSKRFEPIWLDFGNDMATKHPEIKVTNMKCDNPTNKEKCAIPEVEGFPTVVLHKGNTKIVFNDNRTKENLLKFIEENTKA